MDRLVAPTSASVPVAASMHAPAPARVMSPARVRDAPLAAPPSGSTDRTGGSPSRPTSRGPSRPRSRGRATSAQRNAARKARAYRPEAQARPRRAAQLGRRKLQRWLNSHFLDQGVDMHPDDLDLDLEQLTLSVEWRSAFEDLFKPENKDMLELVRSGEEQLLLRASQRNRRRSKDPCNDVGAKTHKRANSMFLRVDKRIRQYLHKEARYQDGALIVDLEQLLVLYLQTGRVTDFDRYATLKASLLASPELRDSKASRSGSVLVLNFENPFHRLITHGVCQFYGLHSTSVDDADGSRVMLIKPTRVATSDGVVFLSAFLRAAAQRRQRDQTVASRLRGRRSPSPPASELPASAGAAVAAASEVSTTGSGAAAPTADTTGQAVLATCAASTTVAAEDEILLKKRIVYAV